MYHERESFDSIRRRSEEKARIQAENRPVYGEDLESQRLKSALAREIDLGAQRGVAGHHIIADLCRRAQELKQTRPELYEQLEREGHVERYRAENPKGQEPSPPDRDRGLINRIYAAFARSARERSSSHEDDRGPSHSR